MKSLTLCLFAIFLGTTSISAAQQASMLLPRGATQSNQNPHQLQTVVLAIDGFSYYAFQEAKRQGLFKEFSNFGAHVAPFPSMTDLSWAMVTNTSEIFGMAGRIKSVEATYFDESSQSIQGDPRDYYRRLAFPKYYMGAFDAFFNPYVESLMYFPTEEVPKLEVKTVIDDLLSAKPKQTLFGYIGAVDSTAHTQLNRLYPILKNIDSEVSRLINTYKSKGLDVEVVLISDHGNIGRFQEGKPEQELIGVDVHKIIERAGLQSTQQLKNDKDVAVPLMALGSWAPVYLKNRAFMPDIIKEFRKESWFDMAVYINLNTATSTVMTVLTRDGEAKVKYDKLQKQYYYTPTYGNPLAISNQHHSRPINEKEIFAITASTPYPDSIYRIIDSASARNFDFPDLILTIKDGYFIQNSLGAFTKMYRTHGSLSAASSFGLFASTKRRVPGQIRSKDLLPFIGVQAKELFAEEHKKNSEKGKEAYYQVRANYSRGIPTEAKDLSQKRIFRHLTKFVADTRPYFRVNEMKSFMDAFKLSPFQTPSKQGLSAMNFDPSKFDVTTMISSEDVGAITDAVLTSGSAEKLISDPRINRIKEKVSQLQDSKTANMDIKQLDVKTQNGFLEKIKNYALPSKRAVMKMYQLPYLLENSIVIQEKPYLTETRDLGFAKDWVEIREKIISSFSALTNGGTKKHLSRVQNLFRETVKEADFETRIYPTPLTKIFNNKVDDLTIVYVPGIYNSIFDKEIFSLGLAALSDELGLRVIQPPVESMCNSDLNADIILDYLRRDIRSRSQRGQPSPRYLFLSYSKGAIDTLQAFVKNPVFVSNYVKGMVSIAAPLRGSSILNTTDLPFALVSILSEKQGPEICQTEKAASKSITPTAMESFWRKNERSLIGLTRYFSVTFASTPEESHIFMKATKLIGQFDEDNDGVVAASSSKFPKRLKALDLGTVNADHLSGILSSRFNQKAFMKGLINTLAELNITDDKANLVWNSNVILAAANTNFMSDRQYFRMKSPGIVEQIGVNQENKIEFVPYANTYELNQQILPKINDPADAYEIKTKLPASGLRFEPYFVLDVSKLADVMAGVRVNLSTKQNMPQGINIEYNHSNMVHFRMDHQFNYESRSPGGLDDNANYGFTSSDFAGEKNWALMRSNNNSIRMTTLAYRFSPLEFNKMQLKLAVTKDVTNADPVKGKTGKDDSAFQVWFTIRDGRANGDPTTLNAKSDKVFLFGYYYASAVNGENRKAGDIFENWYSNKNMVVATLPEAKQLLINNPDMLGKPQVYDRNLVEDLKRAFPNKNIEDLEILAITLQHDSNDTASSSEAYFKSLNFRAM